MGSARTSQPDPDGDSRTHWSLLLSPELAGGERGRATTCFYERYRRVVLGYLRFKGIPPGEDLVQDFFASTFEKDFLGRASPSRGRFRSFLRTAVDHFVTDARRTEGRRKRRPDSPLVRLDRIEDGPGTGSSQPTTRCRRTGRSIATGRTR